VRGKGRREELEGANEAFEGESVPRGLRELLLQRERKVIGT